MRTLFVSRHPGAHAWACRRGIEADVVPHLDVATVREGDMVVGTLPVNLAAEVCERGARFVHLSMRVPPEWRGRELSEEEMDSLGAKLQVLEVNNLGAWSAENQPCRGNSAESFR